MEIKKNKIKAPVLREEPMQASASHTRGRIEATLESRISHEDCLATLQKGRKIENRTADTLILDAGAHDDFLKEIDEDALSEASISDLYRASIANGVVDHHVIDSVLSRNDFVGQNYEKCSTQMAFDFADDIKGYIDKNGVTKINTHSTADLDAVASSYLVKSLIQTGRLPKIGAKLATLTNLMDYGRLKLKTADFVDSLAGVFEAIKTAMEKRAEKGQMEKVFSNPDMMEGQRMSKEGFALFTEIKQKYEDEIGRIFFEVLDAANRLHLANEDFSLEKDFRKTVETGLNEDIVKIIEEGTASVLKDHEQFAEDFKTANTRPVQAENREGGKIPATLIIARSQDPLLFMNMSYQQTPPNTIVAVYASKNLKEEDWYNIGIQAEQAKSIDLGKLCIALNKAEKIKREAIYAKNQNARSAEENELVQKWENEQERNGMSGPEQVLSKDPTVLVAGGSLIASSRSSLLSFEEFQAAISSVL